MEKKYDIFISHAGQEREWVRNLVEALSKQGLKVWYDETEVKPGDSFINQVEKGLRHSSNVVIIITPEATRSNWMALELGAALALHKPLIPVVSEDVPPQEIPGPIKLRKYLPKTDPTAVAKEIARSLTSKRTRANSN